MASRENRQAAGAAATDFKNALRFMDGSFPPVPQSGHWRMPVYNKSDSYLRFAARSSYVRARSSIQLTRSTHTNRNIVPAGVSEESRPLLGARVTADEQGSEAQTSHRAALAAQPHPATLSMWPPNRARNTHFALHLFLMLSSAARARSRASPWSTIGRVCCDSGTQRRI